MQAKDVLNLYQVLQEKGIAVWIDGGWCVDALLGEQTREHADLDIAVDRKDNVRLHEFLGSKGFSEEKRNDSSEWMYVMKNNEGKQVDVHVFEYGDDGKNIYGIEYPYGSLSGTGTIDGELVNCIDPKFMLKFKTAYQPKEKDRKDVQALSAKFNLKIPASHL